MIDADATRPTDWHSRALREGAAILDGAGFGGVGLTRDSLIGLLGIAWLQGVDYGSHVTLTQAEVAFERLKAEL